MEQRRCAVLLLAAMFYCTSVAADEVRKAIDVANASFTQDLLRGDAKAVAQHYTDDAAVIAPGAPIASGTAAIEAFWTASITAGIEDLELVTSTVESVGDLAFEQGAVTMTNADGKVSKGRYIVVWKRVGGEWKLHRDIWN